MLTAGVSDLPPHQNETMREEGMSYMKCGNCESWERCVECGWCVFCAESEKAKLLSEIERLRRQHKELKAAAWDVEKAFLRNQGSMDRAIDTLSDLLQEEK